MTHLCINIFVIIFFVVEPWVMAISKSQNRKYLFNTSNGNSRFDTIAESIASHKYVFNIRSIFCVFCDTIL